MHGRTQDAIRLPSGAVVSAAALNLHSRALDGIRQLQYVQAGDDRLVVRVVTGESWSPEAAETLRGHVAPRTPGMRVEVVAVDAIAPGPNGKVRYVVTENLDE